MDIEKIKQIVNAAIPENYQEQLIIETLAEDKNVIPMILKVIDTERKSRR